MFLDRFLVSVMIFASFFMGSCSKRPKDILSEKKMVSLMVDMELAESYSNIADSRTRNSEYRNQLGKSVLAKHGVTQEQLDTTLSWYGRNLDDYSELYAKVDKEIVARKRRLFNMSDEEIEMEESDILWKYGKNGVISHLGNTDSWILSVRDPDLQKGDRLQWTMHIDSPVQFNGVLGVEYTDGSSEASSSVFIGKNKIELVCLTDTGKTVERIYGTLRIKDISTLPVYADSIMLVRLPYDSVEYRSPRGVRRYGIPSVRKIEKSEEEDSLNRPPVLDSEPMLKPMKEEPIMWHSDNEQIESSPKAVRPERVRTTAPGTSQRLQRPERKPNKRNNNDRR